MIRNIEAACLLARHDEVLAPAAWPNARNCFEAALRILWLLFPVDRFECEARWVTLLREYESFHLRTAKVVDLIKSDRDTHSKRARQIASFRSGVEEVMPSSYQIPARVPNIRAILEEIETPIMYKLYMEASQFAHSTMIATELYRKNLGLAKDMGEHVSSVQWILPLRICWLSLKNAGWYVINRLGENEDWGGGKGKIATRIDIAFEALALAGFSNGRE